MKHLSIKTIGLALALIFTGCEGYVRVSVCVKDNQTQLPIANAVVCVLNEAGRVVDTLKTDTEGCVNKSTLVGCVPKCPTYHLKIFVQDYDTLYTEENVRDYPQDSFTIFYLNKKPTTLEQFVPEH